VVGAPARPSSYYARNRGAERGGAPWILFLDADVDPQPQLIDNYFEPAPGDRVAVLAGGVEDTPLGPNPTAAERFAVSAEQMSQANTLKAGPWAYAQTANAMVRRKAFDEVGGFEDSVRSGGDADLCFRLRATGWELEERPAARVLHDNRAAVRALLLQKARHGSGVQWLEGRYPGSFPRPGVRIYLRRLRDLVRDLPRSRDLLIPTLAFWAFELGRLFPNRVKDRG
jgi:GT2 family glycosyltransferase